jgi:hypothetical protein
MPFDRAARFRAVPLDVLYVPAPARFAQRRRSDD